MNGPLFDRVTVIGLGLIGGSIAKAIKENGVANTVIGCDINPDTLNVARARNIVDIATGDAAASVSESEIVILAVPLSALEKTAHAIGKNLAKGAIVMDVSSVKEYAVEAISPYMPPHVHFIPAHPIAGGEQSGISASRADLLEKKRVIVTPEEPLEGKMLKTVNSFWSALGARVEGMPAAIHDVIYAYVSHLPQLLAFCSRTLIAPQENPVMKKFTRLGASNPALWSEIFILNQTPLLAAADRYLDVITHMMKELSGAPADAEAAPQDVGLSALLFARIASACLITTVMEAEKKNGFPFARFAGGGFEDFVAPTLSDPDNDIEHISNHSKEVAALLIAYHSRLQHFRNAIAAGDTGKLHGVLAGNSSK